MKKNYPFTLEQRRHFMARALELAAQGLGTTPPNPMVGAVLVKNGKIIAEGLHRRTGGDHAEVAAIKKAGGKARGAHLFINLEPCSHFGRTPPCIDTLIRHRIASVDMAMIDPNPKVSGNGLKALKKAGIATRVGLMQAEALRLNEMFCKFVSVGLPWVTLKTAMTLDGKIAATGGMQKRISSDVSNAHVHRWRQHHDAILVGVNTVIHDDPLLTVRLVKPPIARQPLKIILDPQGRTPTSAQIFKTGKTLIVVTEAATESRVKELQSMGAEVLKVSQQGSAIDLQGLLTKLAERSIASILVEGGSGTLTEFVRQGAADKWVFYIAPKLLGESHHKDANLPFLKDIGVTDLDQVFTLQGLTAIQSGPDIRVEAYFRGPTCLQASLKKADELNASLPARSTKLR